MVTIQARPPEPFASSGRHMTADIARLLRNASAAEREAGSPDRRAAYRNTRGIIGAVLDAGFSTESIAQIFQVKADTVRSRAQRNGRLTRDAIQHLVEIAPGELDAAMVTTHPADRYSDAYFAAADVVLHLIDRGGNPPEPQAR